MKLVQIFLPLYENSGRRFPVALYTRERERLVERFGGLTAHMRSPAHGLWKDGSRTKRDDIVIFEVMVRRVDRKWWSDYRSRLERRFKQKEILVRVQDIKIRTAGDQPLGKRSCSLSMKGRTTVSGPKRWTRSIPLTGCYNRPMVRRLTLLPAILPAQP